MMSPAPEISIVIPVYNEEGILRAAIVDLRERLAPFAWNYEIVLAENGSRDRTIPIAEELSAKYREVRFLSIGEPNYGLALKSGILAARGEYVVCDEIDLCDADFHKTSIDLLRAGQADLVIGSKLMGGAEDERPLLRHAASIVYTNMLKSLLGFPGTDTHGLKAFRLSRVAPVVSRCVVDRDVFASEMVIRCYREGLSVLEIPTRVVEKRPPSINLVKRVPNVLRSMARLTWAIRVKG